MGRVTPRYCASYFAYQGGIDRALAFLRETQRQFDRAAGMYCENHLRVISTATRVQLLIVKGRLREATHAHDALIRALIPPPEFGASQRLRMTMAKIGVRWSLHYEHNDANACEKLLREADARCRRVARRRLARGNFSHMQGAGGTGLLGNPTPQRLAMMPVTRFAGHFHTLEWGHRPAQGPSTPQIGSQRLCIRG